jgi:PAS domain S-box-containing protein
MTDIDYRAIFRALPSPTALLSRDIRYLDVSDSYAATVGHDREQLIGRDAFSVFPPQQRHTLDAARASMESALATGEVDQMDLTRFDIEVPDMPGVSQERYWMVVHVPVVGPDGRIDSLIHQAIDATATVRSVLKAQATG